MIIAIIPARIGSKRLEGKNFLEFCGRPLAEWSILCALKCDLIDKIIFTTDNDEYTFDHPKVIIDYRDQDMREYDVNTYELIEYLTHKYKIEGIKIILEPTSPVRTPTDIHKAINIHLKTKMDVVSVYSANFNPNGLYYVFSGLQMYDNPTVPIPTSKESGIDIDYWHQFRIAEFLFKRNHIKELLES